MKINLTEAERANILHEARLIIARGHGLGPFYAAVLLDELDRKQLPSHQRPLLEQPRFLRG